MERNSFGEGFAYCLHQQVLELQLTEKLYEHFPLMVSYYGVTGLANYHAHSDKIYRHLDNVDVFGRRPYAEPPSAVDPIEPLNVLPSPSS